MIIKIYLSKNKNKKEGDKLPDLRIAKIEGEGTAVTFTDIGALWKSKSGKGYSGQIDTEAQPYQKQAPKDDIGF